MGNTFAVVCMCAWASGCATLQTLVSHQEPAKPMELPPTARAGWVEGSFCIGCDTRDDPPALRMIYWDADLDDATRAHAVGWKLTGPGVETWVSSPEFVPWQQEWRAGDYTLTTVALGKVLAEQRFRVAWIPTARGKRVAMVVPDAPHVIALGDKLFMYVPMNVARPTVHLEAVWMQNHRVVHDERRVVSIHDMMESNTLARLEDKTFSTFGLADPAMLFLFVDGAELYGVWSWPGKEPQPSHPVSLEAAKPDPPDLARARVAARAGYAETPHRSPTSPRPPQEEEPLVCAVASSQEARNAFREYEHSVSTHGISDMSVDEELDHADNDPLLTEQERTDMRQHARAIGYSGSEARQQERVALAAAMRFARKFKKGCLAELGIPSLPAMPTR